MRYVSKALSAWRLVGILYFPAIGLLLLVPAHDFGIKADL